MKRMAGWVGGMSAASNPVAMSRIGVSQRESLLLQIALPSQVSYSMEDAYISGLGFNHDRWDLLSTVPRTFSGGKGVPVTTHAVVLRKTS